MTRDADVIIVGGAIAGGALANAFGSQGVRTILIEKVSREIHSTRGDNLHPPTLRILDGWGVLEGLHAAGALPITELAVSHAKRGMIARFQIPPAADGPAGRTISLPHDEIESVLLDRARRWQSLSVLSGTVTGLVRDSVGRACGVRYRPAGSGREVRLSAPVVVGCDGSQSLVRRSAGITVQPQAYDHGQVIIRGEGATELPAGLHWYLDDVGALAVTSRPRGAFRILLPFRLGERGGLLKRADPALHDFVVGRFPALAGLRFGKAQASVYRLARHVAPTFWAPGLALVGDAAHATHPAGATGMSLAITGAARLADHLAAVLLAGGSEAAVDEALAAYDAERHPAAAAAVEANHQQALRIWESDLFRDPEAYARVIDPTAAWGTGGAGWGSDPAALTFRP